MYRLSIHRDWHILWNYVLHRQKKPFLASYKLTYRCNLTCMQCPFRRLESVEPSFEKVSSTIDELYARGSRIIIFEGGEPMLWQDGTKTIADVVVYARQRFLCSGMTTNGTLPLEVPTDVLWVSVDGFEETHNRLRGGDVFTRVLENIRRSSHPRIYAHITINNQNADEIPELVRFLSSLVKGITVQFYYPYQQRYNLFLDLGKRATLIQELIRLKQEGYPLMNSIPALQALASCRWRCADWLVDNANPDGSLHHGCYLKGRGDINCAVCGFSPHTEMSLAWQGNLAAIRAGLEIFFNS
jgi:MoaA/NifB/PqqE/SkfB family radical SAM enzyme